MATGKVFEDVLAGIGNPLLYLATIGSTLGTVTGITYLGFYF